MVASKDRSRKGLARGIAPIAPLARRGTREKEYVDIDTSYVVR